MGKIKRTYSVTAEVDRKLGALAEAARRDKSAQLCVLVEEAHRRMVEEKKTQPTE